MQALKIVSLSISDGGFADTAFDGAISLVDSNRWFPLHPSPDMSIHGIDGQGLWHYNKQTPITLAVFGQTTQDLRAVSRIAVRIGEEDLFDLEVHYGPGTTPVQLGVYGVEEGHVASFTIDSENGEHIRGVEIICRRAVALHGFKVNVPPPATTGDPYFNEPRLTWGVLKVHTNKGRVGEFLSDCLSEIPKEFVHVESVFPEGGTIVGFCSRVVWRSPLLGSPAQSRRRSERN